MSCFVGFKPLHLGWYNQLADTGPNPTDWCLPPHLQHPNNTREPAIEAYDAKRDSGWSERMVQASQHCGWKAGRCEEEVVMACEIIDEGGLVVELHSDNNNWYPRSSVRVRARGSSSCLPYGLFCF